ncbi:uncharacterized protein LOC143922450 isoform X1 [Arctopsyche grandis]|uniref:uncharacterized protein LOC143922450 isoform X1 n=1 Tax=Arctopsyche grandis TaxID=121162 RepID=UPI00406D9BD1
MSALRGHRGARGRLVAYGAAICTVIGLLYLHMLHTQHCHAEHAQLTAIIEYKDRIEHSLAAERSLNADCASALRNQQEEQEKLLQHSAVVQSGYKNLTREHEKIKESQKSERDLLNNCKSQYAEAISTKNDFEKTYEEKIEKLTSTISVLRIENDMLQMRIKQISDSHVKPERKSSYVSYNVENRNISKQIKISEDVYVVPIISPTKMNINNGIKTDQLKSSLSNNNVGFSKSNPESNFTNSFRIVDLEEKRYNLKKPEIPNGVAPELPVDDNMNEKNINFLAKQIENEDKERNFNTAEMEKQDDKLPPNRYKVKLSQENQNYLAKLLHDKLSFGENPDEKSKDIVDSFLGEDAPIGDGNNLKNTDVKHLAKKSPKEDGVLVKLDDNKKDEVDDVNLSQNNGDPVNNENGEDDDDPGDYVYPRVEAVDDPNNKK